MANRTPEQILKEIEKNERRVEDGQDSESKIEELEYEYAQATASLFVLLSQRFVPHDEDEKPSEWDYEVFGISEKRAFTKTNMRLRAVGHRVQIEFYDMEELIVTIQVYVNERIKLSSPTYREPGEDEYIFNVFRTKAEAEECQAIMELNQSQVNETTVN